MRLKAFKVQMYRPIIDSEWVDVDDITVIIGKRLWCMNRCFFGCSFE